jgi:AraC family L-rhamnose operon regulatory protein RhaS
MDSVRKEIDEQSHRFWSCRARSYFIELLFILARIYRSPEEKKADVVNKSPETVDKIILYLNSNYSKKITIPELCTLFNTNKTTIQEQFQSATGQSVLAYLIALRVKLAALMLKDTGLTISEIVERLGFSDNAHFYKTFKKLTGYSPNLYRKQFTWIVR